MDLVIIGIILLTVISWWINLRLGNWSGLKYAFSA